LHAADAVDLLLRGKLLSDVEARQRVAIMTLIGRVVAEPGDVELEHRAAALGEGQPRGVLEQLVAESTGEPGYDHGG
jgi:hypothetical protein